MPRRRTNRGSSKKSIILMLSIIAIMVILAIISFYIYKNYKHDHDYEIQKSGRIKDAKQGVEIDGKSNVESGIKVIPEGEVIDKDGKSVPVGCKIINDSDINISEDLRKAIEIENSGSCNSKISVNGIDVQGSLDIDGGYAKFLDNNGTLHTVKVDGATIMYGNDRLSDNIKSLMESTSYGPKGEVIFDNMKAIGSYDNDSGKMTFIYENSDGVSYGSTQMNNISEKNGIYYSGGIKMNDEQQKYMESFDRILDQKYPLTSNDSFFEKYNEPVIEVDNKRDIENQNNDKDNSNADTNLKLYNKSIQLSQR